MMLCFEHIHFVVIFKVISFLPGIDDSLFECEMKYFTRCLVAIQMQNKNPCNNSHFLFQVIFFSVEMANEKKKHSQTHNIYLNVMRIVITLAVWAVSCRKIAIKKNVVVIIHNLRVEHRVNTEFISQFDTIKNYNL